MWTWGVWHWSCSVCNVTKCNAMCFCHKTLARDTSGARDTVSLLRPRQATKSSSQGLSLMRRKSRFWTCQNCMWYIFFFLLGKMNVWSLLFRFWTKVKLCCQEFGEVGRVTTGDKEWADSRSGDWRLAHSECGDPDVWWWRRWRASPGHWSPRTWWPGLSITSIYNQPGLTLSQAEKFDSRVDRAFILHCIGIVFNMRGCVNSDQGTCCNCIASSVNILGNINKKGWTKWFSPSSISVFIIIMTLV